MSPDRDLYSTTWSLSDCSTKLDNANLDGPCQDVKREEHLQQMLDTITDSSAEGAQVEENSLLLDLPVDTITSSLSISDCVIDPPSTTPSLSSSARLTFPPSLSSNSVVFPDNLSEENLSAVNVVDDTHDFITFAPSSKELDLPCSLQRALPSSLVMSELTDNENLIPSLTCSSGICPLVPCFQPKKASSSLENPKKTLLINPEHNHLQVSSPFLTTFNHPKEPPAHGPLCVTPDDELSINGIVAQESIRNSSLGVYPKTTLMLTDCSDLLGSSRQHRPPSPPLQGNLPLHVLQGSGHLPTMQRCHSSSVLDGCRHYPLPHSTMDNDFLSSCIPSILYGEPKVLEFERTSVPEFERTSLYNPMVDLKDLNLDGIDIFGEAQHSSTASDFHQYTKEEKEKRIDRYRQKRNERNFNKKIKYACRKTLADSRPRIKGRFARTEDTEI